MPRLDPFIEKLLSADATQLVLETGQGAALHAPGGPVRLIRQPLTSEQILGVLAEIAPAGSHGALSRPGGTSFEYAAPAGAVEVRVEAGASGVRVTIAPCPLAAVPAVPPPARRAREQVNGAVEPGAPAVPDASAPVTPAGDAHAAMDALLGTLVERGASDLHLASDEVPTLRIAGDISAIRDRGAISPARLAELVWSIAPARNREEWERCHDTDFAYETPRGRFRANVFADRRGIGAVFRLIPNEIPQVEALGLSSSVLDLCFLSKGLVLVTGPTGSGKSTTLAALIDHINRNRDDHVITIEDPIEFVHRNRRCIVNQREVGTHTESFKRALRAALREDPDVVLVGELRDLETIAIAIETAETGHLVFGTLHTNTAPSTVDRIIDQFPADRQQQIRMMLSESLKGVISQTLCKRVGGGRVAAMEVLLCPSSVSNLIREGKTFQIPSIMQTSRGQGMVTLTDALLDLVKRKLVAPDEAYRRAVSRAELKSALERAGFSVEGSAALR